MVVQTEQEEKELEKIIEELRAVKEAGFGEIRIVIRNGAIHRIIKSEETMLSRESKEQ